MVKNGKRVLAFAIALISVLTMLPVHAEAKKISSISAVKKLARNKVKGAVVTEVDKDYKNGGIIYEVELQKGSREYCLDYRASDGKLIEYKWELEYINPSSASIKFKKAGVRRAAKKKVKNAKIISIVLDNDSHNPEWDVVMKKGEKKYELAYNAHNGKLVEYGWKLTQGKGKESKYIGLDKAKSIALKKVPDAQFVKVEFDKDDGVAVYEVEMKKDGMEYDLKINAKSGKIIEYDVDADD